MIQARRILIAGDISLDRVKIYNEREQSKMGVPQIFEELQFLAIDALKQRWIVNQRMIHLIELRKWEFGKAQLYPVKRVVMTHSEIGYAPAWIIPNHLYKRFRIPQVYTSPNYKNLDQISWVADGKLYLTNDSLITSIQL